MELIELILTDLIENFFHIKLLIYFINILLQTKKKH
jgi:hypothetical protein